MNKRKTNRREFLKDVGSAAALLMAGGCNRHYLSALSLRKLRFFRTARKGRPNILLITTDCQRAADGPLLGSPFLDMPALDKLCKEGAVFKKHYSNAPLCMPAGYTWITGTYPHTHGGQTDDDGPLPNKLPILMDCLKAAGYYNIIIGRMHFSFPGKRAAFHRCIIADGKDDNGQNDDYAKFLAAQGLTRKDYLKRQGKSEIYGVYDWPYDPSLHIDEFTANQAMTVIAKKKLKKPFFLWVSFNGPHYPWDPPAKDSVKYKNMELPHDVTFDGEPQSKPIDHKRLRDSDIKAVIDLIDKSPDKRDHIIHGIRAGHYGSLTFIDRQVEGILRALTKRKLLDKTVVIYSSDHGCHLGDHNLIQYGTHYDCCSRVPFVIRYPGLVEPARINTLSCHIDLMPTILSLAGVDIPSTVEGSDLTPLLTEKADNIRDFALIESRGNTSIVTDRWKMGIYPRDGDGELYDLKSDPDELHNLYQKPEYAEIRYKLLEKIREINPGFKQVLTP